ncbi:MAG: phenylacetate--CoA ligase family protein [Nitrospinota bacterium]
MSAVRDEDLYFEPEIETASRETMRQIQEKKFLEQVRHAYANSPFYRRKFEEAGITPDDVRSLDEIVNLPFTTKDELKADQEANPPWGSILAVPFEDCLRVHSTSATTGRPVMYLDTAEDWKQFYRSYARGLYGMGIRKSDMVMCAFSYGPWIGFWSGFFAAQEIGCLMFPAGGFSTEQRIDALLTYPITVLGSTPSYALYMAEEAKKRGIDLARDSKVRITWHTGEPGAGIPATKKKLEEAFGAQVFDLPGLTELAAWGFSCTAHSGLAHVHEDYCYPEVLGLDTGEPIGPGGEGELIFTSLYRRAMPLLRYRTRDLIKVADRQCPCGRTLFSVEGGVLGRLDDMKKIRGVIVYPRRIEEIVRVFSEIQEFMVFLRRKGGLDEITVQVDPLPTLSKDRYPDLKERMESELRIGLGIRAGVEIVEPGSLPRWDHKAKRVKDEREEVPF